MYLRPRFLPYLILHPLFHRILPFLDSTTGSLSSSLPGILGPTAPPPPTCRVPAPSALLSLIPYLVILIVPPFLLVFLPMGLEAPFPPALYMYFEPFALSCLARPLWGPAPCLSFVSPATLLRVFTCIFALGAAFFAALVGPAAFSPPIGDFYFSIKACYM